MNRRQFTLALIPAVLIPSSSVFASESTPFPSASPGAVRKLDPRKKYEGNPNDILDEPWVVGDYWIEMGLKKLERFPSSTPGTFKFHEGDLRVEFQSIIIAVGGWTEIIVGTQTDLSEIDGVYTAIVRGYYSGEGTHDITGRKFDMPILDGVELFSNETSR